MASSLSNVRAKEGRSGSGGGVGAQAEANSAGHRDQDNITRTNCCSGEFAATTEDASADDVPAAPDATNTAIETPRSAAVTSAAAASENGAMGGKGLGSPPDKKEAASVSVSWGRRLERLARLHLSLAPSKEGMENGEHCRVQEAFVMHRVV